jgi:hypothetical protein
LDCQEEEENRAGEEPEVIMTVFPKLTTDTKLQIQEVREHMTGQMSTQQSTSP